MAILLWTDSDAVGNVIGGVIFTVQLLYLWQIEVSTEVPRELMVWKMVKNVPPLKWLMEAANLVQLRKVYTTTESHSSVHIIMSSQNVDVLFLFYL